MNRTLETLLAAARAEMDDHHATSDAAACLRSAAAGCESLAAQHGIEMILTAPRTPVRVAAEADLVERILAPLLENACRYARHAVRVSVARDPAGALITVDDDGPGVPADDRETIFEPGRRGADQGATAVATQGAGLGLSLARRLARAADGEVEATECDGGGRFVVRLPVA